MITYFDGEFAAQHKGKVEEEAEDRGNEDGLVVPILQLPPFPRESG